ncbi:MAG: DUF4013 domain-containing protein [Rhizobiales bacterium]|nr:DUF4013 domain-containing protein [Hyphomicrobiales bacterium]
MTAASTTVAVPSAAPARRAGVLRWLWDFAIGTLLSTNPFTAVIVLGWLMRRMRWIAAPGETRPGWLMSAGETRMRRLLGGLVANTREGVGALFSQLVISLPFTALMALAWWAGWNNSFSKGYEQAAAGPLLSLAAIVFSLPIIAYMPMALAHQAAEQNWKAFFDWRTVRQLIARTPWRYLAVMILLAAVSAPVMFFRVLPVFAESIWPDLPSYDLETMDAIRLELNLAYAATVFVSALIIRGLSARCYAAAQASLSDPPPWLATRMFAWTLFMAASLAIVFETYVAQFFNYNSLRWFLHPHLLLPAAY